jgi:hypothetical protein
MLLVTLLNCKISSTIYNKKKIREERKRKKEKKKKDIRGTPKHN